MLNFPLHGGKLEVLFDSYSNSEVQCAGAAGVRSLSVCFGVSEVGVSFRKSAVTTPEHVESNMKKRIMMFEMSLAQVVSVFLSTYTLELLIIKSSLG